MLLDHMGILMTRDGAMAIGVTTRKMIGAPTIGERIARETGAHGAAIIGVKIVLMIGAVTIAKKPPKTN